MAPFTILTTLASILALSTSVTAQTGTGTGLPIASATIGAPYPLSNGTLPFGPTGTGTGISLPKTSLPVSLPWTNLPVAPIQSGASCPVPTTVTTTTQVTYTVTVTASSAAAPTAPFPIPGSSGLPIGTGTGTGSGFVVPTGFAKRMEMRGLKQERVERKRGARFCVISPPPPPPRTRRPHIPTEHHHPSIITVIASNQPPASEPDSTPRPIRSSSRPAHEDKTVTRDPADSRRHGHFGHRVLNPGDTRPLWRTCRLVHRGATAVPYAGSGFRVDGRPSDGDEYKVNGCNMFIPRCDDRTAYFFQVSIGKG